VLSHTPRHAREPLQTWANLSDKIMSIRVVSEGIHLGQGENTIPIAWRLKPIQQSVFMGKLMALKPNIHPNTSIFEALTPKNTQYKGMRLKFKTEDRQIDIWRSRRPDVSLDDLIVFDGFVRDGNGVPLFVDPGRELEYWLWSTTNKLIFKQIALRVLDVFTFRL